MSKKRSQPVVMKQGEKPMIITREQMMKAERAARRQVAVETGTLRAGGCGVHGGNDRARNRRDRQDTRKLLRRGDWE